ncbi:MAG: hypothetical protein HPM95_09125 [Alphaproteobacteria bacterium]|nr:hypothetical protein [Alphaproteobacteria bacterium]
MVVSEDRSGADGAVSLTTTVLSSGVSMVSIAARRLASGEPVASSITRLRLAATSAEVIAPPLWKVTPSRRVNV